MYTEWRRSPPTHDVVFVIQTLFTTPYIVKEYETGRKFCPLGIEAPLYDRLCADVSTGTEHLSSA